MSSEDDGVPRLGADPLAALTGSRRSWLARVEDATGGLVAVPPRAIAAVAVLVVLAGGGWLVANRQVPIEPLPYTTPAPRGAPAGGTSVRSASPPPGPAPVGSTAPVTGAPPTVWVSAAGAVGRPGLYQLREGARLSELLAVAGGLTADADPDRINLAAIVRDGERVYLPHRGEVAAPGVIAGGPSSPGGGAGGGSPASGPVATTGPAAPVDLNTATIDELDRLPGIGPSTAAAIVDHRERHGPFASVDDLKLVRGIGPAKLEALRGLVVV